MTCIWLVLEWKGIIAKGHFSTLKLNVIAVLAMVAVFVIS